MKRIWAMLAIAILSTLAMGQQLKLDGRLISTEGKPVPNVRISIADEQSAPTDKNGKFSFRLPAKLREGETVVITLNDTFWVINQPLDGEWTILSSGQKPQLAMDIIVAARSSKAVWTDARIEKELTSNPDQNIERFTGKFGSPPEVTKAAFEDWAKSQNSIANTLSEQASRVASTDAARLFGEAAAAYRRALLVYTPDSLPQDWATTQHNLGYVLQEQGVRSNGVEAVQLLAAAVEAYRRALSIRTRSQLPLHWAMTQNDLGNALQAQGVRAQGKEANRLLTDSATAYGEALLVFTREFMPRQWAMTQHNLGSALYEQGTRTEGAEAMRLLGEAVAAYRQALLVRTREQMPQQWAMTQNNLANSLQAQGTRADKLGARRLLDEALTAYRQSLAVLTREETPRLWAMTKHNVGSALQEQAARADGPEARRLFGEAVAAYREALLVWTRQRLPQQWAMAQNNLGRAFFNLKEWASAAQAYENVLAVYPDFRPAYERARFLNHEVLFDYQQAFKLNESWLQGNPNDLSAIASFAETHFTTSRFEECARRISAILSDDRFDERMKIPIRLLEIANLIALKRAADVPSKIERFIEALNRQPAELNMQRSFAGIELFINENQELAAHKVLLFQLFKAVRDGNREAMIQKLRVALENFQTAK